MEEKKLSFREGILRNIANTLAKYQDYDEEPPETDSSIETRKKFDTYGGTGFGASLTRNSGAWYDEKMQLDPKRIAKYKDYDLMDNEDPELSSALDIYADNAAKGESETDTVINIVSENQTVINVIDETIEKTKLHTELWSIIRNLVKNGDEFEEVVVHADDEIHRLKHLDHKHMVVIEDEWGRLDPEYPYIQKDDLDREVAKFKNWQVIHFQLDKDRGSKYGVDGSVLFPIRKLFKQLSMIEDSVVLARLTRAIQRYAYLVDTEGIEPGEPTLEYVEEVMNRMKKRRTINPKTGKMDLDYNPMSLEEDVFISTKDGSNANVKVLQGSTNLGVLADVEYFRNKKFAGVKVPKAYLSHEKDVRARAMITEQDVQFARTVRRVQLAVIKGLHKLFDFALMTRGIDPNTVEYEIQLPILSTIDELRLWQVKQLKANVSLILHRDLKISLHWILTHLLDYDEEDVEDIIKYLEDKDSIDNKLRDRDLETQEMFMPPEKPEDGSETPERPKGGKVPTKRDNEEPTDTKKDKDRERKSEEDIDEGEVALLKDRLNYDLADLQDIIEWIVETKSKA